MRLLESVPLAARTTLRLGGPARWLAEVADVDDVRAALAFARERGAPVAILGGGSNTVAADAGFPGLLLHPVGRAVHAEEVASSEGGGIRVRAGAGLPWDELCAFAVRRGWAGIAALSGIPGQVGAAPVQNIGAYGEQLAEVFESAEVFDVERGVVERWDGTRAAFGYRQSAWKQAGEGRWLILAVTLRLRAEATAAARYPDLRAELQARGHDPDAAPLAALRAAVLCVRGRKAMVCDPEQSDSRSAGSFFVNPEVSPAAAEAAERALRAAGTLAQDEPLPSWPTTLAADGSARRKLSAAFLIERSGFRKGQRAETPGIALSRRHVLALCHHGGGSADGLLAFAAQIAAGVEAATGIRLEREPRRLG
ncbi:MAG: UDP-N-acetylenolpyruvoylglucosamine reductase [Pseudomonadota bacterium]